MEISDRVQKIEEEFKEKQKKLKKSFEKKEDKLKDEFEKSYKRLLKSYSNDLKNCSTRKYRIRAEKSTFNESNDYGSTDKLPEEFFARSSKKVAKDLVGRVLVCNYEQFQNEGVITEVGAYEGEAGKKQKGLSYAPGKIYIPAFYGKHTVAIATEKEGTPSVVTIRKVKVRNEEISGEDLYKRFKIDKNLEGASINNHRLYITGGKVDDSNIELDTESKKSSNCTGYYILNK